MYELYVSDTNVVYRWDLWVSKNRQIVFYMFSSHYWTKIFMLLFEEGGAYCFTHVSWSVCRYPRPCAMVNWRILCPTSFRCGWYTEYLMSRLSLLVMISRSKVKVKPILMLEKGGMFYKQHLSHVNCHFTFHVVLVFYELQNVEVP